MSHTKTIGDGRFALASQIHDYRNWQRYLGTEVATGHAVHVTCMGRSKLSLDDLRARLMYDVAGVSRCLFIGERDSDDAEETRLALVEELPAGGPLRLKGERDAAERLHLARCLAHSILDAAQKGVALASIEPDFLYVTNERVPTVTLLPRGAVFVATRDYKVMSETFHLPPFEELGPFVDPLMLDLLQATTAGDVYCWGLIVSSLFENGKHPFLHSAIKNDDWLYTMAEGERDPFRGPAAIGRILDRVLVPDPGVRMLIEQLVAELSALKLEDVSPQ